MTDRSGPSGVIHDLGYRGYDGPRVSTAAQARTLYATGVRHAFGLGRSGRSKVLPFLLLAIGLLPSVIVVGVVTMVGLDELPFSYAALVSQLQMPISLFAAAQAPVLFSRDLRHRSIVLYLARPLSSSLFAVTRWASLTTAVLTFMLLPTLVLYAGALLAGLDVGRETPLLLKSIALQVLVAMLLAAITGVISSWALRRGFAVVASIVVLIVVSGIVLIFQDLALYRDLRAVGEVAGLFSPWTLHNGLAEAWSAEGNSLVSLTAPWVAAYVATATAVIAGCVALLVRRFSQVGAR
jgi:ABC-2 type transport system permease protein